MKEDSSKEFEANIGNILRQERNKIGLSLELASQKTGVSKAMLGQIERGESSPTISTLWKISSGLKIPMATLLTPDSKNKYSINRLKDMNALKETDLATIYNLFPFDPLSPLDALHVTINPHSIYHSTGHENAIREYIYVVSGTLTLYLNKDKLILEASDSISFKGDEDHTYENTTDKPVEYLSLIKY